MFGFFKPKKRDLKLLLADIIEHAMVTKRYDPDSKDGDQFMTCVLYSYGVLGLKWINMKELRTMQSMLIESYGGNPILLSHVAKQDPYLTWNCGDFGRRIVMCNHYWRFIRELRGEAPLYVAAPTTHYYKAN